MENQQRKTTGSKAIALDKKVIMEQYRMILAGILAAAAALGLYDLLIHFIH